MKSMLVLCCALAGCAAANSVAMQNDERASGHWDGTIGRDGWSRPVSFDLRRDGDAWRGTLHLLPQASGSALKEIDVHGDEVRLDTDALRFVGHLMGDTLAGTVIEIPTGAPAGQFSVSREDRRFLDQ
jgi:hypothetical protein